MISVTDYGAVGDGVADDTAAIQTALDAGGWVYVPPGVYRLMCLPLRVHRRTRLTLAPNARLVRASEPGMIRNKFVGEDNAGYTGHGDLIIEGGIWDMNGAGVAPYASAMTLVHASGITVRDTTILDVPGAHGLDLIGVHSSLVDRVKFAGFWSSGDRDFSEGVQIDGSYGSYSGDCAPYDKTMCRDVTVKDSWFGGSATPQMRAWPRGVGSHGYHADVIGYQHGHIRVLDNTMAGVTDAAVRAWLWQESRLSRNIVDAAGKSALVVEDNCSHISLDDNDIYDSGYSGIWVTDTCDNIAIRGNTVVGSSRAANDTHYGIRLSVSCSTVDITGNRVRRRHTGNQSRYGLSIAADCSGIQRWGNDLRWSGISGSLKDDSPSPVTSATDLT